VVKRSPISYLLLLQLIFVSPVWCEFYQWTDSRGVIHFTDNYHVVPEPLRQSPDLVVHELRESPSWLQKKGSSKLRSTEPEKIEPNRETPQVVHYELEQTNIVVGQNGTRFPHRRRYKGTGAFRPNFNSRQYIHPSAFNQRPHKSVRARQFPSRSVSNTKFNNRHYTKQRVFNRRPHKSVHSRQFRSRNAFRPNFNSRQYIHPSVFNHRPRKSVHSRRFRSRRR
jgi:hypothetical protein